MQFFVSIFSYGTKSKSTPNKTNKQTNCQKQTDNPKWLILLTYIADISTTVTDKKCENSIYVTHEIRK